MKRLILLRHAKSSWEQAELADHERPLAKRGERDAPLIGGRLRERQPRPSLIVTSPAERALRTATIVAECLKYPRAALAIEPAVYLASPAALLKIIRAQSDAHASLMIVGHNPGLTELANRLLPELALENLPTAGVVDVDIASDGWSEVGSAPATLAYYDYPKNPATAGDG